MAVNSDARISFRRASACNRRVTPIGETRRLRLLELKKNYDTLAAMNEALGRDRTDATFSQIINRSPDSRTGNPKMMGDQMARGIEEKLDLQPGWMDAPLDDPEAVPLSPEARRLAMELDTFPAADRAHLIDLCRAQMAWLRNRLQPGDAQRRAE